MGQLHLQNTYIRIHPSFVAVVVVLVHFFNFQDYGVNPALLTLLLLSIPKYHRQILCKSVQNSYPKPPQVTVTQILITYHD